MPARVIPDVVKIALFAAGYKAFRYCFQLLPTRANLFGFRCRNLVIRGGGGDDVQQVGEFLDNLVGGGNEVMRMRDVLWILNKETAGALAYPLDQPVVASAGEEGFNTIKRIAGAAAGSMIWRLSPFIDHGERESEVGGDLFGRLFLENLAQQFVGLHGQTMGNRPKLGKQEGGAEPLNC